MFNLWDSAQPGPRALWSLVHSQFPQTRNLGIYNKRNVAGTNTPSAHAEGRALDIGLLVARPSEKVLGDQLFTLLINNAAELGLDHIIWNRKIWSAQHPTIRQYVGHSPHTDHIHVAFTREGSQQVTFGRTTMEIATLRSGLEDLTQAESDMA